MKVLMVHKTYKGGVAVYVKEVSRELRRNGLIVEEITRNEDLKIRSFQKSYFKMKSLFKKWSKEYDVIHTHDWSITYPAIKANAKNLIATFHAFPTNPVAKFFQNYCIKKLSNRAIVVSPKMKESYRNSTFISNGVNLKIFKKCENIKRNSNLAGLAQSYNLEKIVDVLKKEKLNFVYTKGNWKYEDLGKFYSKIGIFISIPYKQAGFNLVWLEAMACKVPFIIGNNDGIGEKLPIIKVSDFIELKNILNRILNGEVSPLKNSRDWIIDNGYLWSKNAENLINIYEGLSSKDNKWS
jgi:glycosyltransferase involved in cell wall biosynthesis